MKKLFLFVLLLFTFLSNAQLTDLARLEYSFIPKNKSEDQYTRIRALVNYPIKIKEDTYFVIGGEYNHIFLNLNDTYPFDTSSLEKVTVIDLNLAYTHKLNDTWRVAYAVSPRLAATLNDKITSEDLFLNGGIFFIKDRTKITTIKKPYRLILGLTYNTTAGIPFPLPLVSYFSEINENWSYTVGVPKMNVKYKFDEKKNLQAFVGLDGYYAHLQRPVSIQGKQVDNVSLSLIVGGLGYEYSLSEHLVLYSYAGYTLRLNNVLRNADRENVFTLDDVNAFYLRTGIKFRL